MFWCNTYHVLSCYCGNEANNVWVGTGVVIWFVWWDSNYQ